MRILLPLIIPYFFISCQNNLKADKKQEVESFWTGKSLNSDLFIPGFDTIENHYIAEVLTISDEKPLKNYNQNFSLRLIHTSWSRSILIRLELKESETSKFIELKAKELEINASAHFSGFKDSIRGTIFTTTTRKFPIDSNWNLTDSIMSEIDKFHLLELPVQHDFTGDDGYSILIEMLIDGEYKVLNRWSPDYSNDINNKNIATFCRHILELQHKGIDLLGKKE